MPNETRSMSRRQYVLLYYGVTENYDLVWQPEDSGSKVPWPAKTGSFPISERSKLATNIDDFIFILHLQHWNSSTLPTIKHRRLVTQQGNEEPFSARLALGQWISLIDSCVLSTASRLAVASRTSQRGETDLLLRTTRQPIRAELKRCIWLN